MLFSECVKSVALLALPGLLREDLDLFLSSEEQYEKSDEQTGSPVIVFQGADVYKSKNFAIYADGIKIMSVKSVKNAFMILIACFFVFNIAYPKKMIRTLTFLQKVMLNLQDSIKTPNPVVTLITNINRK